MIIKNTPFPQIEIGFQKAFRVQLTEAMVRNYAMLTRDCNPTHLDEEFAAEQGLEKTVAHSMLIPSLLSGVFGNEFPGPGTKWKSQTLNFHAPAYVGENVTFDLEVMEKEEPNVV
ncbi:MAG: MaoC family dehydratase, partial [Patescibacteria group bacterium]